MTNSRESHFFILYSARHQRCGHFIERADYRVVSKDDLIAWSRDLTSNGKPKILSLHCDKCAEDISPTHLRIIEDTEPVTRTVVPEMDLRRFDPKDWILKK